MKSEITVSLEWAKKLHEAGWVGSEHFLWAYHCFDYPADSKFQEPFLTCRELEDHYHQWEFYDAPTAEEILRKLGCGKLYFSGKGQWTVILEGQDSRDCPMEDSAADACAACWISLPAYMRHSSSLSEV